MDRPMDWEVIPMYWPAYTHNTKNTWHFFQQYFSEAFLCFWNCYIMLSTHKRETQREYPTSYCCLLNRSSRLYMLLTMFHSCSCSFLASSFSCSTLRELMSGSGVILEAKAACFSFSSSSLVFWGDFFSASCKNKQILTSLHLLKSYLFYNYGWNAKILPWRRCRLPMPVLIPRLHWWETKALIVEEGEILETVLVIMVWSLEVSGYLLTGFLQLSTWITNFKNRQLLSPKFSAIYFSSKSF